MAQNVITENEFIALAKGLQDIQNEGFKYKDLYIWLHFSKYKIQKRLGSDGNSHPSINVSIFFSNDNNPLSYTFYDWEKKKAILNKLTDLESDLKNYKEIAKIIYKMKEKLL